MVDAAQVMRTQRHPAMIAQERRTLPCASTQTLAGDSRGGMRMQKLRSAGVRHAPHAGMIHRTSATHVRPANCGTADMAAAEVAAPHRRTAEMTAAHAPHRSAAVMAAPHRHSAISPHMATTEPAHVATTKSAAHVAAAEPAAHVAATAESTTMPTAAAAMTTPAAAPVRQNDHRNCQAGCNGQYC